MTTLRRLSLLTVALGWLCLMPAHLVTAQSPATTPTTTSAATGLDLLKAVTTDQAAITADNAAIAAANSKLQSDQTQYSSDVSAFVAYLVSAGRPCFVVGTDGSATFYEADSKQPLGYSVVIAQPLSVPVTVAVPTPTPTPSTPATTPTLPSFPTTPTSVTPTTPASNPAPAASASAYRVGAPVSAQSPPLRPGNRQEVPVRRMNGP